MKVKELLAALGALPESYGEHDVVLCTDLRASETVLTMEGRRASAPLVRISAPAESSVKHQRVWLYADGNTQ